MFNKVLVGTDGSPRAGRAVDQAIDLAKSEGASLHIVAGFSEKAGHWENVESSAKVDIVHMREAAEQLLMRTARKATEAGVEVDYSAREGDPAEVILDAAEAEGADVIVLGNKGMTGASRFFLGGVPNKVTHHAPCSVLIVRTD